MIRQRAAAGQERIGHSSASGAIRLLAGDFVRTLVYNLRFDSTHLDAKIMEAERINAISALLNDLTGREAELRRYL